MESIRKIMFVSAMAGAAILTGIHSAPASPLQTAIGKLYAAPNSVQRAVDLDYCKHWDERAESKTARARLSKRHAVTYDAIESAVHAAADATNGTDSALDAMRESFCEAVSNR